MEEELKEQGKNSHVPENFRPHLFKKGQSGNPLGRPPGRSLKDRAKAYLSGLTDEEAVEYFEGMNKKDVWEMAEGKAESKQDINAVVEHKLAPEEEKEIDNALDDIITETKGNS